MSESDDPKGVPKHNMELDLQKMLEIVYVGVRRVSVFMKYGVAAERTTPENFDIGDGNVYSFWPKEISDERKNKAKLEFQTWLTGSCLKELDQYFAYFLDDVWFKCDLAELHGKRVPSDLIVGDKTFVAQTNTASKLQSISSRVGADVYLDSFSSLSLARNSLTHGMGRVRKRDTNLDDTLKLSWIALHMFVNDGEKEISLNKTFEKKAVLHLPNGGEVFARIEEFSQHYKVGEKLSISPQQIAEICWFYIHQATKVHAAMVTYLQDKGIKRSNGEGESAV